MGTPAPASRSACFGTRGVFLSFPLLLIFVYAFNSSNVQGWPIDGPHEGMVPRRLAQRGGP